MSVHKIVNIYKFLPVNVVKYKIIDVGDFKRRRETAVATHTPSFDPTRTKLQNERTAINFVGFD
jgi:hypothetical protein